MPSSWLFHIFLGTWLVFFLECKCIAPSPWHFVVLTAYELYGQSSCHCHSHCSCLGSSKQRVRLAFCVTPMFYFAKRKNEERGKNLFRYFVLTRASATRVLFVLTRTCPLIVISLSDCNLQVWPFFFVSFSLWWETWVYRYMCTIS